MSGLLLSGYSVLSRVATSGAIEETHVGDQVLLDRCLTGELLVIRGFLKEIGAYELLHDTYKSALKAVNNEASRQIETVGLESIHTLLTADEIFELVRLTEKGLRKIERKLFGKIIKQGLQSRHPIWVCRSPIFRIHIPYDYVSKHRSSFEKFRKMYGNGRVTSLRPHRDSWFDEPYTCVTAWIPLGSIVPGNGMVLFPDDYDQEMRYEKRAGVTKNQPVSRPFNLNLSDGDALFFHANQLHASEVNISNQTRAVITVRFAVDNPKHSMLKPWRYVLVNPRIPLPLSWFLQSNRKLARWVKNCLPLALTDTATDTQRSPPAKWSLGQVETSSAKYLEHCTQRLTADDLVVGQPIAISNEHLLVKVEQDGVERVWRMNRRCPHEGADLALAHAEGNVIHCPWHNLPIDIQSGNSPCKSLRVESVECDLVDGEIVVKDLKKTGGVCL